MTKEQVQNAREIIKITLCMSGEGVGVGLEIKTPIMRYEKNRQRMEEVHNQIRKIGQEISDIVKADIEGTLDNVVERAINEAGKDMARVAEALERLIDGLNTTNRDQKQN